MCPESGGHCLPGDEGALRGSGALGSIGVPPDRQPWTELWVGMAWDAQTLAQLSQRERESLASGSPGGWESFHEGPAGGGTTRPSPIHQMEGYMRAEVASDTLVALSRNHFSLVMYELQHHLKPLDLTDEFVIVTLAKLAHGNGRARVSSAPASGPFGLAWSSLPVSASLRFCSCLPHTLRSSLALSFSGIPFFMSMCLSQLLRFSLSVSASHVALYSPVIPSPPNVSLSSLRL